jgi:DNA-directed RNA polymerase subunit alpha
MLDLSVRAHGSLWSRGVRTIGDLVRLAEIDVLKIENLGHKSFRDVVAALAHIGLHLGMDVGDWSPRQMSS